MRAVQQALRPGLRQSTSPRFLEALYETGRRATASIDLAGDGPRRARSWFTHGDLAFLPPTAPARGRRSAGIDYCGYASDFGCTDAAGRLARAPSTAISCAVGAR
jgi:hypothetical protein